MKWWMILAALAGALLLSTAQASEIQCTGPKTVSATGIHNFELGGARGPVSAWLVKTAGTIASTAYCLGPDDGANRAASALGTAGTLTGAADAQRATGAGPCNGIRVDITTCTGCSGRLSFCTQLDPP